MEVAFWVFRGYENWAPRPLFHALRRAGTAFALEYVEAEDHATNFVDIGPVRKRIITRRVCYLCVVSCELVEIRPLGNFSMTAMSLLNHCGFLRRFWLDRFIACGTINTSCYVAVHCHHFTALLLVLPPTFVRLLGEQSSQHAVRSVCTRRKLAAGEKRWLFYFYSPR